MTSVGILFSLSAMLQKFIIYSLPYTEAFIAEVMRIRPIAPLTVPHCAAKDTLLQGFKIPKVILLILITLFTQLMLNNIENS